MNSQLCSIAQKWAEHLVAIGAMQHSTNKYKGQKLGENIATKWSSNGANYTGRTLTDLSACQASDRPSEARSGGPLIDHE